MEPETATQLIATYLPLAREIQDQMDLEAMSGDITHKKLVVGLLIYAAGLADKTHMSSYDFLQLADTAYQIVDSGDKPAA